MKIALDAMGGDFAPRAAVAGAALAAQQLAGKAQVVLIGPEDAVRPLMQEYGVTDPGAGARHPGYRNGGASRQSLSAKAR